MNVSGKIRILRKKSGLSQEQLADRLGVSRQAVSKWESKTSIPDIEKLALLSELFNVSMDYLIKDESATIVQEYNQQDIESINVSTKIRIIDVNKRKLAAYDEFGIDMIGINNNGEGVLITGTEKNKKVKIPVCALYGITKGILGINKRTVLGYYASLKDAQKELMSISKVSKIDTQYELKYAAKMQGVCIVDSNK